MRVNVEFTVAMSDRLIIVVCTGVANYLQGVVTSSFDDDVIPWIMTSCQISN